MKSGAAFILVYHRIAEFQGGLHSLYTPPEFFDWQMKYLWQRGYRAVTLSELQKLIVNKADIFRKFVLTFDDGYEDNFSNAYPILKKYNFPANLFIHVGGVGRTITYPKMPESGMLNWEQLRRLKDVFEIGSHTLTHRDLSTLSQPEIKEELVESKKILEDNLGLPVKHFCYPFGKVFDNYFSLLSDCGYETAVSLQPRLVFGNSVDFYKLPRLEWKNPRHMSFRDFWKNRQLYWKLFLGI